MVEVVLGTDEPVVEVVDAVVAVELVGRVVGVDVEVVDAVGADEGGTALCCAVAEEASTTEPLKTPAAIRARAATTDHGGRRRDRSLDRWPGGLVAPTRPSIQSGPTVGAAMARVYGRHLGADFGPAGK